MSTKTMVENAGRRNNIVTMRCMESKARVVCGLTDGDHLSGGG